MENPINSMEQIEKYLGSDTVNLIQDVYIHNEIEVA